MDGGREEGAGRTDGGGGRTHGKKINKIKQTALWRNDASFFFFPQRLKAAESIKEPSDARLTRFSSVTKGRDDKQKCGCHAMSRHSDTKEANKKVWNE